MSQKFGVDQLATRTTVADLFDDPEFQTDDRTFFQRARHIFLPENRTDRVLTLGATALVVAVLFQYLLFPGFGFAKRVLPLLVPAPITQALKYLVPDDVKDTLAQIVPGAERIQRIIEGKEIPVPEVVAPIAEPPVELPNPEVVADPILVADTPVPLDLTLPIGAPLAPGDWFQRSATVSVVGAQPNWDINLQAASGTVNTFSSSLMLQVESCSVPWVQTSASPQRWTCSGSAPYASVSTSFGASTVSLARNHSQDRPLYLRFIVSWPEGGEVTSAAAAGQASVLRLELSAVPR